MFFRMVRQNDPHSYCLDHSTLKQYLCTAGLVSNNEVGYCSVYITADIARTAAAAVTDPEGKLLEFWIHVNNSVASGSSAGWYLGIFLT